MADDDENKPKKHTLESLFKIYANISVYKHDFDNVSYDRILLSQIDNWLIQAKLIPSPFSLTDTGMMYIKFKKWRLPFEDFIEFLQQLVQGIEMTYEDLKELLIEAGIPMTTDIFGK